MTSLSRAVLGMCLAAHLAATAALANCGSYCGCGGSWSGYCGGYSAYSCPVMYSDYYADCHGCGCGGCDCGSYCGGCGCGGWHDTYSTIEGTIIEGPYDVYESYEVAPPVEPYVQPLPPPSTEAEPFPRDFTNDGQQAELVVESGQRLWFDNTGRHYCVARLVAFDGEKVVLLKENGKTATVPLARLSQFDERFARQQPRQPATQVAVQIAAAR